MNSPIPLWFRICWSEAAKWWRMVMNTLPIKSWWPFSVLLLTWGSLTTKPVPLGMVFFASNPMIIDGPTTPWGHVSGWALRASFSHIWPTNAHCTIWCMMEGTRGHVALSTCFWSSEAFYERVGWQCCKLVLCCWSFRRTFLLDPAPVLALFKCLRWSKKDCCCRTIGFLYVSMRVLVCLFVCADSEILLWIISGMSKRVSTATSTRDPEPAGCMLVGTSSGTTRTPLNLLDFALQADALPSLHVQNSASAEFSSWKAPESKFVGVETIAAIAHVFLPILAIWFTGLHNIPSSIGNLGLGLHHHGSFLSGGSFEQLWTMTCCCWNAQELGERFMEELQKQCASGKTFLATSDWKAGSKNDHPTLWKIEMTKRPVQYDTIIVAYCL